MADYRVTFTKTGRLKYISHLDLQRAVTRLLLRSGIPIQWSEGFNPHPRINIALPLPIYQEGVRELLDFKADDGLDTEDLKAKLQSASFEGMDIISVAVADKKLAPKKALYTVKLQGSVAEEDFKTALKNGMPVIKKTKSGEKEIDIAPMIEVKNIEKTGNTLVLSLILPATPNEYLNPAYIVKFFGESVEKSTITREEILL